MQTGDDDARAASPWAPPDAAPTSLPPAAPPGRGQQPWTQQPWGQQPVGWTPPPDPQEARRRRRRAILVPASVVVLLVAGLSAVVVDERRREARVRADIAAAVPALKAFVEQERGLAFREEVDVEVLDDDAFLDALYEGGDDEPAEEGDSEATLDALGLIDPDTDLDEEVSDSLDEGVVGFYDPQTNRLAVRGRELDAFTRLVLVHELTHALQDQHFDIDRPDLDEADDERALAFRSLVEGDAVRVETAWLQAQPTEVQDELDAQFGSGGGGEPVVEALLGFPYYAGPELVAALLERGGQPALDDAFRTPPTTVEQVVDPAAGAGADVAAPEAQGEVLDEGVLGVLSLALLLQNDPLDPGPERGWNGDRYVTYATPAGDTCTEAVIAVDDASRGAALAAALQGWTDSQPDASVRDEGDGTLRLSSCDRAF